MIITREPEFHAESPNIFAKLGRSVLMACRESGRALVMTGEAFLYIPRMFSRRYFFDVTYQLYVTGVKSLGVITVVALFTGMILALQTGLELRRFGQQVNIGTAVCVSLTREMGPFMTALIVAASVGSAIAAQLGTMTVSDEISALEIMGISPVKFLVMPRLIALMIMMPLLTVYTDIIGIIGGAIVGSTQLDVSVQAYFDNAIQFAANKDLYVGIFKAWLFGVVITAVSCHQGFCTKDGAVGVGQATRKTVVISFLTILVIGYMITRLFYA